MGILPTERRQISLCGSETLITPWRLSRQSFPTVKCPSLIRTPPSVSGSSQSLPVTCLIKAGGRGAGLKTLHLSSLCSVPCRYLPLFLALLLFFSGCFCQREQRGKMPPAAWMLLVPNAAYYWSDCFTAGRALGLLGGSRCTVPSLSKELNEVQSEFNLFHTSPDGKRLSLNKTRRSRWRR